ncbi:MAG: hypothetical protein Q4C52_07265 [Eubacteriales bacterium]|nr:hypothetical protein [Eubacteriales bacterium]
MDKKQNRAAAASNSKRIKRIHERVCRVKTSEEVGVKYMQAWEEKYYEREEGREEGRREGADYKLKELIKKKLAKGKSVEEIADALEETEEVIRQLISELKEE